MPEIEHLTTIFKEDEAPYTLPEIAKRMKALWSDKITYNHVHHAYSTLADNPNTCDKVKPVTDKERYLEFSIEATRRIARRVAGCHACRKIDAIEINRPRRAATSRAIDQAIGQAIDRASEAVANGQIENFST